MTRHDDVIVQIVVDSMRKYFPRVRVVRRSVGSRRRSRCDRLGNQERATRSFLLSQCVFITVTAYQNQLVGRLQQGIFTGNVYTCTICFPFPSAENLVLHSELKIMPPLTRYQQN